MEESIIAAIRVPDNSQRIPTCTVPVVKEAGIFNLTLRPHFKQSLVFKKSSCAPNCVVFSKNHVFAAQANQAVVHVYSREKGSQELTVPFGEKVTALATAGCDGSWLVIGTESGDVFVWETYNGRLVKLQQAHVQAVSSIAVDRSSEYFLTGSTDSTILVWAFATAMSYSNGDSTSFTQSSMRTPQHTLTAHRAPITGLCIGHSSSHSNIAISVSEDRSALVWHISAGTLLRTYLLPSIPKTVAIDPADRACYIGLEDGSVQMLNFYESASQAQAESDLMDQSAGSAPIQASEQSRWYAPSGQETKSEKASSVACTALSFDATRLLTGHLNGKIGYWDVGTGRYQGEICILPGPVTNLNFTIPRELLEKSRGTFNLSSLIKPKFNASHTDDLENANFHAELVDDISDLEEASLASHELDFGKSFRKSLYDTDFSKELIWSAIAEFAESKEEASTNSNSKSTTDDITDFISLDVESEWKNGLTGDEVEFLRKQVESLQNLQRQNFKAMRNLKQERELLLHELSERERLRNGHARDSAEFDNDEEEDKDNEDEDEDEDEDDDDDDDEDENDDDENDDDESSIENKVQGPR